MAISLANPVWCRGQNVAMGRKPIRKPTSQACQLMTYLLTDDRRGKSDLILEGVLRVEQMLQEMKMSSAVVADPE